MGAWIETKSLCVRTMTHSVAPYMGAWIETATSQRMTTGITSHPNGCVD